MAPSKPVPFIEDDDLVAQLDGDWIIALTDNQNRIRYQELLRQIRNKRRVPAAFIQQFREKYPDHPLPDITPSRSASAATPLGDSPAISERTRGKTKKTDKPKRKKKKMPTFEKLTGGPSGVQNDDDEDGDDQVNRNQDDQDEGNTESEDDSTGSESIRIEDETNTNVNKTVNEEGGSKRKFGWLLRDYARDPGSKDSREADGTLKALKDFTGDAENEGKFYNPNKPPEFEVPPPEVLELWNAIFEVNGKVFYDSERLALGHLNREEYFLVPNNWEIPVCEVDMIGIGCDKGGFEVDIHTLYGIYALAKEQAGRLQFSEEDQIKWALLRMEAFKSGWYARQPYCAYAKIPKNYCKIMLNDMKKIVDLCSRAYTLCSFLPFLAEFNFRAYGCSYRADNATEYEARASRFASSAAVTECLNYMDSKTLYGKALAWIGVKRPMEALKSTKVWDRIPAPFQIRKSSSPAGQAIVGTSVAVIKSMECAGWWSRIKNIAEYDDSVLLEMGKKVQEDPWKYHMHHRVYGVEGPSVDEKKDLLAAREKAMQFAPILQAYIDSVMQRSDLAKAKAIKKHADAHGTLYQGARNLFKYVISRRMGHISDVYAQRAFLAVTEVGEDKKGKKKPEIVIEEENDE